MLHNHFVINHLVEFIRIIRFIRGSCKTVYCY